MIEGRVANVYVKKRPGVDEFMEKMSKLYEVVLFTASLPKYAEPLLAQLDTNKIFKSHLFRDHCTYYRGYFVKDMSRLGRSLKNSIIVDVS